MSGCIVLFSVLPGNCVRSHAQYDETADKPVYARQYLGFYHGWN